MQMNPNLGTLEMETRRSSSGIGTSSPSHRPLINRRRSKGFHLFTQQNLPAQKPLLTPGWVITIFLLAAVILVPTGIVALRASQSIIEIVDRYDTDCVPEEFRGNKVGYIKDASISKNCTRRLKVAKRMKAPVNVYYHLDNFYQNHRRYVKSRSDSQLRKGMKQEAISQCKPLDMADGLPIIPCGLIAWSLFNDTFDFSCEKSTGRFPVKVNRKNIARRGDRELKFGKDVYPFNFQNGSLTGGARLDPSLPLSEHEDLMVWMRVSALPSFRKLYGRIDVDFDPGDVVELRLVNNYNTYSFGGKKKVVLATESWLGGKNDFLGVACISSGCFCILVAVAFALLHVRNPRPGQDSATLTWNRKNGVL